MPVAVQKPVVAQVIVEEEVVEQQPSSDEDRPATSVLLPFRCPLHNCTPACRLVIASDRPRRELHPIFGLPGFFISCVIPDNNFMKTHQVPSSHADSGDDNTRPSEHALTFVLSRLRKAAASSAKRTTRGPFSARSGPTTESAACSTTASVHPTR